LLKEGLWQGTGKWGGYFAPTPRSSEGPLRLVKAFGAGNAMSRSVRKPSPDNAQSMTMGLIKLNSVMKNVFCMHEMGAI
jgi:hypothetical protein